MCDNPVKLEPQEFTEWPDSAPSDFPELTTASHDVTPVYPVEICMNAIKPKLPMFIYKFGDGKCYKFRSDGAARCSNGDFPICCSGCELVYKKIRKEGAVAVDGSTRKRTDGFQMLSDPHSDHVPRCVPYDYELAISKSPLVNDVVKSRIIEGKDISMFLTPTATPFAPPDTPLEKYPVSMCLRKKPGAKATFIHRLEDDPKQCYKFRFLRRRENGEYLVACMSCFSAYNKKRKTEIYAPFPPSRKVDGYHMFSDPLAGHQTECRTYNYDKTLKTSPLVSDAVRERMIHIKAVAASADTAACKEDMNLNESIEVIQCSMGKDVDIRNDEQSQPDVNTGLDVNDLLRLLFSSSSTNRPGNDVIVKTEYETADRSIFQPYSAVGEPSEKRVKLSPTALEETTKMEQREGIRKDHRC